MNSDIKNILIIIIVLTFFSCKEKHYNELEKWNVYEFYFDDVDLLKDTKQKPIQVATPLHLNYNDNSFLFKMKEEIKGNFYLSEDENKTSYIIFKNSTDKRFDGKYILKIDTTKFSKNHLERRIIIDSEILYIEGRQSVFNGI